VPLNVCVKVVGGVGAVGGSSSSPHALIAIASMTTDSVRSINFMI
jgi:hypothetical protein